MWSISYANLVMFTAYRYIFLESKITSIAACRIQQFSELNINLLQR